MNDNLFGRLGRYPAESRGVHFGAEAVTDFTIRVELATLFKADLQCRFRNDLGDLLELKYLDFPDFFVVLDFDFHFVAKFFAGG